MWATMNAAPDEQGHVAIRPFYCGNTTRKSGAANPVGPAPARARAGARPGGGFGKLALVLLGSI